MKQFLLLLLFALPLSLQAQQARWIDVDWTASTSASADPNGTYNIYRVSGSCPTGTVLTGGTVVGTAASTAVTFRDSTVPQTVTTSLTFCYAITFLGSNGIESVDSNLVSGVLLPPPAPPTNAKTVAH